MSDETVIIQNTFENLDPGNLFIAPSSSSISNMGVFCIKCVHDQDEGDSRQLFVMLGPLPKEDSQPKLRDPQWLRSQPVLDVLSAIQLRPSIRPEDLTTELNEPYEQVGSIFFHGEDCILAVYDQHYYGHLCLGVSLSTGRLDRLPENRTFVASLRWDILDGRGTGEPRVLVEHEAGRIEHRSRSEG